MKKIFSDKLEKPNNEMLSAALGESYKHWQEIQSILQEQYGEINPVWKYYGAKNGWILKMILKKRNLFFFGPYEKYFLIAFVFGEKAVKAIEESDLPLEIIEEVKGSKRHMEGRVLRIEVRKKEQINSIIKLTEIKVNN